MPEEKQEAQHPTGKGVSIYSRVPTDFYQELVALAEERHRSFSDTVRMLLMMGMKIYRLQAEHGIIRKADRKEFQTRIESMAQQIQSEREARRKPRKGQRKPPPAILLLGCGDEDGY